MRAIAEKIQAATEYLTAHPEDARATDSAAVARLDEGLRVTVTAPDGQQVVTDMVESVGGTNTAPSPGWLLRAAIASCTVTLAAMRAAVLGVALTEVEVTVDSESDDLGILGIDASVPAGPLSVRLRVRVTAPDAEDAVVRDIVDWAVAHCPVTDALTREVPLIVDIEVA